MEYRPPITWNAFPLLRILLPLSAGIGISFYIPAPVNQLLMATAISFFLLLASHVATGKYLNFRYPAAVFSHITLLLLGALLLQLRLPEPVQDAQQPSYILVTIHTAPEQRSNGFRSTAYINSFYQDNTLQGEKILLYLPDEQAAEDLLPGDRVWIKGKLSAISAPVNPGIYDFRRYMALKGIATSLRVQPGCYIRNGEVSQWYLLPRYAEIASRALSNIFNKYMNTASDKAVLAGILLGKRADLEDDVIGQFQDAGIMHILSVSGMHVAILYGLLLVLFRWIPVRYRKIHVAKDISILMIIWAFAYITGFSPAVRRAAFLFTLILTGKLLRRQAEGFNLLAGSALVLLILDPGLLFNAGFQLSYAAVAGIMLWYKPFYSLWTPKNKFSELVWQTIAVSIAAQIATLPLTWYYFGTFPLYFLLGNLLAVPVSGLIMWLGIFLLLFSPVAFAGKILAFLLHYTITFLLWSIAGIAKLPHASISEGYLPPAGVFLSYIFLIALSIFLLRQKKIWLVGVFSSIFLLTGLLHLHARQVAKSSEVYIWHIPQHSALVSRTGRQLTLWIDSSLTHEAKTMSYNFDSYLLKNNIRSVDTNLLDTLGRNYIAIHGNIVGILRKKEGNEKEPLPVNTRYTWIQQEPYLDTQNLLSDNTHSAYIADGSNRKSRIKLYRRLLTKKPLLETGEGAVLISRDPG